MTRLEIKIKEAYHRLRSSPYAPHLTALELSPYFSELTGSNIFFKQEHMQRTGSFKYRGALNKLLNLPADDARTGVIAASSGNHGLAAAFAAQQLGIPITIYVPAQASEAKLQSIHLLGAKVNFVKGDSLAAERKARKVAELEHKTYLSPYNDLDVIIGQGTIGHEILEQRPDVDAIFIAVGGGGLISGIGAYVKAIQPNVDIIACWPENAPAMCRCLEAGTIIDVQEADTLSDGTAGGIEDEAVTFPLCQQVIDRRVLISEQRIYETLKEFALNERQIIEGAAVVALAGALDTMTNYREKNIVVVLCGRNIALPKFMEIVR